jgi:hypothetical protein
MSLLSSRGSLYLEVRILPCPFRKFHPASIRTVGRIIASLRAMFAILQALGMFVADLFKSRSRLEAENLAYYNQARTHLALQKDAPLHRAVQRSGAIIAIPILAGLHHQYVRI